MTGRPGTGQWKRLEEVPRRTSLAPLAPPCFVLCFIGMETEGLLDYQGRAGIISIVRWTLRPVIFGVELLTSSDTPPIAIAILLRKDALPLAESPLRAKGTLISEPRFSTACEMRFFPREKGKTAFSKKNPRQRPFSLSRVGKLTSRRG